MSCTHWIDLGTKDGGYCKYRQKSVSYGRCGTCGENTDKDRWPPKKTPEPAAAAVSPCGGCAERAAARRRNALVPAER
jgi:hypothetical protein